MFQLQLPKGQASLHLQHADQELTLEFIDPESIDREFFKGNSWRLNMLDTSGLPLKEGDSKGFITILNHKECAALLYLWANNDEPAAEETYDTIQEQYKVLESFLKGCPPNLRPIP